ncbi:hypothetical protein N0V90_006180 [Kalmusia sp. IMI 367209]|nr:hypothetical protein N0V90_006180 [Kalmusia sp. IMI 367209]
MARLNTRTSATPLPSRASTTDSLYRDPTPIDRPHGRSTARQSSYPVMSPMLSMNSDKENDLPISRATTPQPHRRVKGMVNKGVQRPPTPDSGSTSSRDANKRRRTDNYSMVASDLQGGEDEDIAVYDDGNDDGGRDEIEEGLPSPGDDRDDDDDEDEASRYYDPHQNPEKRRQVRAGFRNLQRELDDNRDEYIKPGSKRLEEVVPQSTRMFGKVRMTGDAVLDSRLLSTISDLSTKQLKASVDQGNHGVGIDVDQFVSRCIFFMKEGHPPGADDDARTQSRTARHVQDDDEEVDNGEGLDWAFLGRNACFPSNRRPPLSGFLLGPLSVQKRVQTTTRRARSQRQPLGPATRPQEIREEDIKRSENSNVTHLVTMIKTRLSEHIEKASEEVEKELGEYAEEDEGVTLEDMSAACKRHRIYSIAESEEAGVSLFDFAINPDSFGQTVENLFYISFLIREGAAKVVTDNDGLPLLTPEVPRTYAQQREQNVEKRQAIFSIDYATWQALIEAFDIKQPLIPHRVSEETNVTAGGWYG